jgi:hypothetical protein
VSLNLVSTIQASSCFALYLKHIFDLPLLSLRPNISMITPEVPLMIMYDEKRLTTFIVPTRIALLVCQEFR